MAARLWRAIRRRWQGRRTKEVPCPLSRTRTQPAASRAVRTARSFARRCTSFRGVDVLTIGNALVDVLAPVTDEQLAAMGIVKNSYELVDAETADRLYDAMPPAVEISGGAAANTAVGVVSLGGTATYIGKVRDDQLGAVFTHDLRATGVRFDTAPARSGPPTGRALTLITPDA